MMASRRRRRARLGSLAAALRTEAVEGFSRLNFGRHDKLLAQRCSGACGKARRALGLAQERFFCLRYPAWASGM